MLPPPLMPVLYLWLLRRPGKPVLRVSNVDQKLGSRLRTQTCKVELTVLLALLAAMLIVTGAALSVLCFGRVV